MPRFRSRATPLPRPSVADPRRVLLVELRRFVRAALKLGGVHRIALIGSLTTPKPVPKDADALVTIEPGLPLAELAQLGRRFKGRAQQINLGAEVFLAEPDGRYIGRTCSFRECHYRVRCEGQLCGEGRYLNNDLHQLTLGRDLILAPPIELWPTIVRRCEVPDDVEALLLHHLETGQTDAAEEGE